MKDLSLANNLDEIKWLFDKEKLLANGKTKDVFEAEMKAAIEKLPLTDELARKLINSDAVADDLLDLIERSFSTLFLMQ
jgi:hypothetical protein